jgi:hypothetical protein
MRGRNCCGVSAKANYPRVKIVALNPSRDQLLDADYNFVLNDHDEWLSLLAAAAS